MLKQMRDSFKHLKWMLWLVLIATLVSVFFWSTGTRWMGGQDTTWVASVSGESISAQEFVDELRSRMEFSRRMLGDQWDPRFMAQSGVGDQIIGGMVGRRVALREAKRLGLNATPPEIFEEIRKMEGFQDEKGEFIGVKKYTETLRTNGYTPKAFERSIGESIALRKFTDLYRDSVVVTEDQIRQGFEDRNLKAKIRYVRFDPAAVVDTGVPTDAELRAYHGAHTDQFSTPPRRRVSYLRIGEEDALKALAKDDELRKYVQEHADGFAVPAGERRVSEIRLTIPPGATPEEKEMLRRRAEQAASRAIAGENFAALAREYSDDLLSAQRGGDIGHVARAELIGPADEAVFAMTAGEVRGPIESPVGYHILKLTEDESLGAHTHSFEEVRDEAAVALYAAAVATWEEEKGGEVQELLDKGLTLEQVAEKMGTKVQSAVVDEGSGIRGLGDFPGIRDAVLAEVGTASKVVNVFRGVASIRADEVIAPAPLPFEEARDKVAARLRQERAGESARRSAEEVHAALAAGTGLDEAAAAHAAQVVEAGPFPPKGNVGELGPAPLLRREVFRLAAGETGPVMEVDGAHVVFQVAERSEPDPAEFAAQRSQIEESLRDQQFNLLYSIAVERLRDRYRVRINQPLVDQYIQAASQSGQRTQQPPAGNEGQGTPPAADSGEVPVEPAPFPLGP
jgi:peptidyl-prolyl cis-trans isomerase D